MFKGPPGILCFLPYFLRISEGLRELKERLNFAKRQGDQAADSTSSTTRRSQHRILTKEAAIARLCQRQGGKPLTVRGVRQGKAIQQRSIFDKGGRTIQGIPSETPCL